MRFYNRHSEAFVIESRYDQASSGNNESRYHQAAPAEYDFPVFSVVISEACLKKILNIKKLGRTQKLDLK